MIINGTQQLVIDINDEEHERIVENENQLIAHTVYLRQVWKKMLRTWGLPHDAYLTKNNLWEISWEEYGGCHSWEKSEAIRPATDQELLMLEAYGTLYNMEMMEKDNA